VIPSLATALFALALGQASPDAATPAPEPVPPPAAPALPAAAPEAEAPPPPVPSLVSAEPLRGTSLVEASAGWPRMRLAYAQGLSHTSDLGGFADFDYGTTELRAGLGYRGTLVPPAPPFEGALRLSLAWYHDSGGQWIYKKNHSDEGLEIGVGISYSRRGAGGVLSLLADVPITITFRKDGGVLVVPKAAFAYQAPLYGPFTIGLQLGLGLRVGIGNAPLKEGMAEITVLALAGWRL